MLRESAFRVDDSSDLFSLSDLWRCFHGGGAWLVLEPPPSWTFRSLCNGEVIKSVEPQSVALCSDLVLQTFLLTLFGKVSGGHAYGDACKRAWLARAVQATKAGI